MQLKLRFKERKIFSSKKNLMLLLSLCVSFVAFAQSAISGKVTSQNGEPIIGASIKIKGTSSGAITDVSGLFKIGGNGNETLVISYIGYLSKEVILNGKNNVSVQLTEDLKALNEVVVVGYGTQRKSDITGAVSSIKAADISKIGGSNIAEALQGKTPGVEILNQGGPGAAPTVLIRGLGTNGDASPLYVVDGMMVSGIGFLASNDVASMEILKDASSTAIYGSRGANGVVLITTKKGKTGKAVVNFNATHGFQFLARKYDVCDAKQYAQLVKIFDTNAGSTANSSIYANIDALGKGTDWIKESTQNGITSDYQLSVAGGTDKTTYNIGASYHSEDGILKYTKYDRLTLRTNNEYKLNKRITIGHNLSLASSNNYGNAQWNGGRGINSLYRMSPLLSIYKADGTFTPGQDQDIVNPYAALYQSKDVHNHPLQFVGNGWLNYEIINGLTFRSSYGVDYTNTYDNSYEPTYSMGSNQSQQARLRTGYTTANTWLWENTLTYDKQLGTDHHINLLAGYTAQNYDYNLLDVTGTNLLSNDPNYKYIQALPITSLSWTNSIFPSSESILSYLFRANYNYKDRYLVTVSLRADGSSKFASGHQWGYFPSTAFGWHASEEDFLKDVNWISNLKLRGSWGQIGSNKISNYQTYSTLNMETTYNAVFNNVFYQNATITKASNPDITWEISEQTDFGLEFGTLNNRLKFELDYYNRDTKNLLLTLPIPGGSTGFSASVSNAGIVRNSGFEFLASWDDKIGDLSYGVKVSGSANKNKILDFHNQIIYTSDWMVPSTHISQAGSSIGNFYGYKVSGIAQTQAQIDQLNATAVSKSGVAGKQYWSGLKPGDLIFQDITGDGFIDSKDKTDIGSPHPDFTGGITLSAAYKGLDIAIDMMGSFGGKIYNDNRNQFVSSGLSNLNTEWLNSWTPTNTNTDIPRYATNTSTSQQSDFCISDGTYIKARYIELGYSFSKELLSKIKISSLRIYLNTTNPFYITKYKGFSPEVSNAYGVTTMGDDFRTYPVTGSAKVGLNITF